MNTSASFVGLKDILYSKVTGYKRCNQNIAFCNKSEICSIYSQCQWILKKNMVSSIYSKNERWDNFMFWKLSQHSFLEESRTPKFAFEMYWPLTRSCLESDEWRHNFEIFGIEYYIWQNIKICGDWVSLHYMGYVQFFLIQYFLK